MRKYFSKEDVYRRLDDDLINEKESCVQSNASRII